jgi:hypothetical protein
MKAFIRTLLILAGLALILMGLSGCDSPGYNYPSSGGTSVYMGYGYGSGFYDPWYGHGHYGGGGVIIVNPPAQRPVGPSQLPAYGGGLPSGPRPTPMRR